MFFVADAVVDYLIDPSTSSPAMGTSCSPSTASILSGLWHHREARSRPPISLYDVSYAGGAMEFHGQRSSAPQKHRSRIPFSGFV
jgi:hypothetical protein